MKKQTNFLEDRENFSANDFVNSFIEGQRKYSNKRIFSFNLTSHKDYELFKKIAEENLLNEHLSFLNCDLSGIFAHGAFLPFIRAENTLFMGSDLEDAILSFGIFENCNFRNSLLNGADLSYCDLNGSTFEGAEFRQTILKHANLNGVEDLKKIRYLVDANYKLTTASKKQQKTILKIFKRKDYFPGKNMFMQESVL